MLGVWEASDQLTEVNLLLRRGSEIRNAGLRRRILHLKGPPTRPLLSEFFRSEDLTRRDALVKGVMSKYFVLRYYTKRRRTFLCTSDQEDIVAVMQCAPQGHMRAPVNMEETAAVVLLLPQESIQ